MSLCPLLSCGPGSWEAGWGTVGFGTCWRRTQRLEIALWPFICCVSKTMALVSSELFWTPGGLEWFREGVSFSKTKLLFSFSCKVFLPSGMQNVIQPGIPLTSISNHEFHEKSWVSSWSKWLNFFISLEYSYYQPIPCQNQGNFCFENGMSPFSVWEDVRGREWGVNSEENKGMCMKRRADGFVVQFSYLPKHFIVGIREALPWRDCLTQGSQGSWTESCPPHSACDLFHIPAQDLLCVLPYEYFLNLPCELNLIYCLKEKS